MPEAYPLHWPPGWPRTAGAQRERAKFGQRKERTNGLGAAWKQFERGVDGGRAQRFLLDELRRLGATNLVLSTNVELRQDGRPYANRRSPDDPGVAVYFTLKRQQRCIPCDRWDPVADNVYAIAKSIEALRGLDRWGAGKMVDAAFSGFKALPATGTGRAWWDVLGLPALAKRTQVDEAYRRLALERHPDRNGGDSGPFIELGEARREAHSSTSPEVM